MKSILALIFALGLFSSVGSDVCSARDSRHRDQYGSTHDVVVFLRQDRLWAMNADGSNQARLTESKVDQFSVSKRGGVIAYESKGCCYLLNLQQREPILIADSSSFTSPVVSPDGKRVALVKNIGRLSAAEANALRQQYSYPPEFLKKGFVKATAVYLYDVSEAKFKPLATGIPAQMRPKEFQKAEQWRDDSLYWEPDGKKIHFRRDFMPYAEKGGMRSSYLVDLASGKVRYIGEQEHIFGWHGNILEYMHESGSYTYDISSRRIHDLSPLTLCYSPNRKKAYYLKTDPTTYEKALVIKQIPHGSERTLLKLRDSTQVYDILWRNDQEILLTLHTLDPPEPVSLWSIRTDGSGLKKLAEDVQRPAITRL